MSASPIEQTAYARDRVATSGKSGKRLGLFTAAILLVVVFCLSLAIGARTIAVGDVLSALFSGETTIDSETIWSLRLPRTLLGLMAGIAFALSGALMQALTRNPLADPGILGINAGAAFAMVAAIGLLGISHPLSLIWFAFAGTGLAAVAVYAAAMGGRAGATPLRLTLAGVAIGAVLRGLTSTLIFLDPNTFDHMLNWEVGSLAITGYDNLIYTAPFVAIGIVLALISAPVLNVVALGDDQARSLGAGLGRARIMTVISVMLLTGAATAAAGPLGFLGLMVPYVARSLVGSDQRWIFAYTLVLAPIVLLTADIIGRLSMRPAEIQVGIVTAFIGAPVLIWLVRARKVTAL
ncbi:iron chelate uptake ABC transporter family permease subunit [Rhizobium sp. RM]|uniref:FecCD family ABC transporter permease n=1 Tax=Rhizobium sp. RM TaxID=2748079 RepID=UPI00110E7A02|nr:iron chelate uptake ABC transporter family permease subunit [Rhizobium sp. RM]NWJ24378.1 iron chelate uptake ABC transporter family permease subunit [Rhizobium sp. RM]TMV21074.1 iron chelate uptake ABC transporter family permease subunit [Rhizobium sp. Td3]